MIDPDNNFSMRVDLVPTEDGTGQRVGIEWTSHEGDDTNFMQFDTPARALSQISTILFTNLESPE
jgi:hypothetical protein